MPEREPDLHFFLNRFSQSARIVLFHARWEVSSTGGGIIEPEHVALGVLRADRKLISAHMSAHWTLERVKSELKGHLSSVGRRIPTSVEVPLGPAVHELIARAVETADQLGHREVGAGHLLAALLQDEESSAARVLRDCGVSENAILERLRGQGRR